MRQPTVDLKRRNKIKIFLGVLAGALAVKVVGFDVIRKNFTQHNQGKVKSLASNMRTKQFAIKQEFKAKMHELRERRVEEDFALSKNSVDQAQLLEIRRKRAHEDLQLAKLRDQKAATVQREYMLARKIA